jgi:hypothetical protein
MGADEEPKFLVSVRLPFLNWSFNMKSFLFRAGLALLGGLALISMGCQEDNEAAIKEQEAKSSASQDKNIQPPPKSPKEFADRMKAQQPDYKASGYPGAKSSSAGAKK